MPAGDNTVTITIQAVDASAPAIQQAEQRILSLGAGVQEAATKTGALRGGIEQVGAAGTVSASSMSSLEAAIIANTAALQAWGTAGASAGTQVAVGMGRAAGGMRMVSGLGREMGLNIDYGLRRALASNQAFIGGLQAMIGIFAAIGAISVLEQLGKGIYDLYEKWFDVNKAVEAYKEKAGEAAEEKLFDTASLEESVALLGEIGTQISQLQQKKSAGITDIPGGGFFQYVGAATTPEDAGLGTAPEPPIYTAADDAAQAKALENQDKLTEHQRQGQQQLAEQWIKGVGAYDEAVTQGYAHIDAHEKVAIAEITQRYEFMSEQEENLVKIHNDGVKAMSASDLAAARAKGEDVTIHAAPDPQSFEQQRQLAITAAQQEASGQRVALARTTTDELIKLDDSARDAKLAGISLLRAQEEQAIAEITRKYQEQGQSKQAIDRAVADTRAKYDADIQKTLDEQAAKLEQMQHEAASAGLTGIAKIQSDSAFQIGQINSPAAQRDTSDEGVQNRAQLRVAAEQKADAEILQEQQKFGEDLAHITEHNADQVLSGYAKIDAETRQSLGSIAKAFEQTYSKLDFFNPADLQLMLQGLQQAQSAVDSVQQNAQRERLKYSEDTDRQISATEAEAARALEPPWEAAQQKIIDDYDQRLQKIREQVQQQVITEQQGAREAAAAWELANAEMVRQTEQSRDQIAGQLKSLIDNPAKYMEERAKTVMLDIFANWIQQAEENNPKLQGILGGILGQNKVGTGSPQNALGQLFGIGSHAPQHSALGASPALNAQPLEVAGSTLTQSGTVLFQAGSNLSAAAQALYGVASTTAGAAGVGPGGVVSGGSSAAGIATSGTVGGGFLGGFGGGGTSGFGGESLGLPTAGGPLGTAQSISSLGGGIAGAAGGGSTAGGISSTITQGLQLSKLLQNGFASSSSSAALLNPSGGFQPTDAPPTGNGGVIGTVPGTGSDDSDDSDSGSGISSAFGTATGLISGGLAAYGGIEAAANSTSFSSGLVGVASTALAGASIGTLIAPGIGTAIGAAAGAAAGLVADIFGDHGKSKMENYNIQTVIPGLQKDLDSYSFSGGSYDSASQAINQLQIQSISQAKQWGTGAMSYYQGTMVPEFQQALATAAREGTAGRSNVTFGASQFHDGGDITDFGDLWTSASTGFIHAELGERVISRMENAAGARSLSPNQASAADYITSAGARSLGGNGGSSGATHVHLHVHALNSRDTKRWLKEEGIAMIQTELNYNASRYAGKALNMR